MNRIDCNGIWEFYYAPQKFIPGVTALPDRKLFTGHMAVPGYWDDHYDLFDEEDFFSLRARFNPDYRKPHFPAGHTFLPHASSSFLVGTGYYRRTVSADFPEGSHVILSIGPAMWGCAVYCNGTFAGEETGYSVGTDFDLTGLFHPGEENEIVAVVCNVHDDGGAYCRIDGSHDGKAYGTRPGQHRGLAAQGYQSERAGIGGGIALTITGAGRMKDCFLSFETGIPHWHVECENSCGKLLEWSMSDGGTVIDSGTLLCSSDKIDFYSRKLPQNWSDRNPKLYQYELKLIDNGAVTHIVSGRCGSRVLKCEGYSILVNGRPVYFRGATEHCYFPESCNPHFDKAKYLHDLGQLQKAGFNFIRCHTWCPPEPFYEACDELGIYVQTEVPSVYSYHEVEAILCMIRRHACAVIFCEGNEKQLIDQQWERMRHVFDMVHELAPGMLINPQEAMRGVEYALIEGRKITPKPFPHDAERLAEVAEYADLYGSLSGGHFSYSHDMFPGVEQVEYEHSVYKAPCLCHEIGILGGYLDFSLEKRYEGTYIGQDLFIAAREYMQKNKIYQYAGIYYENNCRFISSIRKQLVENLRSCPSLAGYDYLGGIDTHWHLTGYPCGVLNEFYEEKYGESFADILCYNGESVLLCSALNRRNRFAGTQFREKILFSYYGEKPELSDTLSWNFRVCSGDVAAQGIIPFKISAGKVSVISEIEFTLPSASQPYAGILQVSAGTVKNQWTFWFFPRKNICPAEHVRCADALTDELIDFASQGGAVFLTGGFPSKTREETFRPHTAGRTLGHSGMLVHEHPVWRNFPHEGFGDWQFFPMMSGATSIVYDNDMPEFQPLFELIPSFKLIRRKSMLSEFQVGKGRIVMCGFVLGENDPAGSYLKYAALDYLGRRDYAAAPEWSPEALKARCRMEKRENFTEVQIDEGGRARD